MKKIGIITLYYKSTNYGGNLQAYALCKFLQKNGYDAEQICFLTSTLHPESIVIRLKRIFSEGFGEGLSRIGQGISRFFRSIFQKVDKKTTRAQDEEEKNQIAKRRKEAFRSFNEEVIPHSEEVYYADTIEECVAKYDAFITGSDQVWNFRWYHPIYFLDFVGAEKTKMSYAASFAMDSLNKYQQAKLQKSIQDYKAISLREKNAIDLVKENSKAVYVVDPTFLLDNSDWDEVCSAPLVDQPYVFCYFLGENEIERELARAFALEHNLKLATIPHAGGGMREIDVGFGDFLFYDASPQDFLSLIKNAKYIFTDSFHAVVFSTIYQKQYFVFNRNKRKSMNSRIIDITSLVGTQDRYCNGENRENLTYINGLKDIDYEKPMKEFLELKEKSIQFLLSNLE